jgi:hypothetical protein
MAFECLTPKAKLAWYDSNAMNGMPDLKPNLTRLAQAVKMEDGGWHLEIPAGSKGSYRLAQLDDYRSLARRAFPWNPPLKMSLQARVSAPELPGTWGFGLWNDPFAFSMGLGGMAQRFPALPNAAWFFYASPHNYLSFRNDLPARGFLAATFRSKTIPAPLLALASPILAVTIIPVAAQGVRSLLRQFIRQDATLLHTDVTGWHVYTLDWQADRVRFYLDEENILETNATPCGPLSLVLWIDNQYAALPPRGRLAYGALANPEAAWMEIRELTILEGK